jgi:GGDEF domain-containing protein
MTSIDKKAIGKSTIIGILIAIGLFCSVVILSNSWIQLLVLGLTVVSGVVWLVSHGLVKRFFKYLILAVMIFSIFFTVVAGIVLLNAGYPPSLTPQQPGVTILYSNILNASLTKIIQSVENTPAFAFLVLEHPGKVIVEGILLDYFGHGSIDIVLYQQASNLAFRFAASEGYPYHATVSNWGGTPFSLIYPSQQTDMDGLRQIDSLGLNSFYKSAIDAYQNKTGIPPNINTLSVAIQWESQGAYQGMTMLITGGYESNNTGHGVFFADFQPNGTLLYISVAN